MIASSHVIAPVGLIVCPGVLEPKHPERGIAWRLSVIPRGIDWFVVASHVATARRYELAVTYEEIAKGKGGIAARAANRFPIPPIVTMAMAHVVVERARAA